MKNLSMFFIFLSLFSGVWAMNVWPEPVMIQETDYYQNDKASVVIGNNTIVVWTDFRENHHALYAQKLSETGQKLWDPEGVKVAEGVSNQRKHKIIASSDGGVIIIWKEYYGTSYQSEPNYLVAQKLDMNGSKLWLNCGKVIYSQTDPINQLPSMFSDIYGGLYLTEFSTGYNSFNNHVIHVDSEGEESVSFSFDFTETNGQLKKAIFHSEGFFVAVYKEQNQYKMAKFDTLGNHISTPVILGSQMNSDLILKINESNRTIAIWVENNSIKAQILFANGTAALSANHILFNGNPEPHLSQFESGADKSMLLFKWGVNGYFIIKLSD
ncbi:MAG: hypothetical protein KA886_03085, partial [Candidatus Cloacimonetes bacterium]|nr:hypothetical protein [Candidatus Cloacimonadota bacterium]